MGTEAVKGIVLDMSKIGNIKLSGTAFHKLHNLRYLHFYSSKLVSAQFHAPGGLECLPEGLRYLYWDNYPSKSLPFTSFLAEKLVELVICNSQLEELWNGIQNLPSLKKLNMSGSTKLMKVPDLSAAPNLEELCLEMCRSLVEIPSSLKDLSKLATLGLAHCSRLECLPDNLCNLKSLQFVDVSYCGNLHGLQQTFGNLNSLVDLFAPDNVCNLKACTVLHVGNLQSLKHLGAGGSGMMEVPSSIDKLRELGSEGLILPPLIEFPIGLCSVTSLERLYLDGNHFESIPESIKHLLKLNTLGLSNCKELKYLPESIKSLPELSRLDMRECISLDQNQSSEVMNHFMVEYKQGRRQCIPIGCHPGSEVPEKMTYKNERGPSLSFSFELLQHVLNHKLEFYACVVSDRHIYVLATKVNFMDESGLTAAVEGYVSCSGSGHLTIEWEHVILESEESGREIFVKGRKYAVEFQFLGCRDQYPSGADKDITDHCSSEGITKCGVFPLFDHQTV